MKDLIINTLEEMEEFGYDYLDSEKQEICRNQCGYYDEGFDEEYWLQGE